MLEELFSKPRFSHMLQFYAAITGLHSTGFSELIIRLAKEYGKWTAEVKDKRQLSRIICCLYEAKNQSLCKLFIHNIEKGLKLSNISLHSSDCICICNILMQVVANEFELQLNNCKISDRGCRYLSCISKETCTIKKASLNINVCGNDIRVQGAQSLCNLLKANLVHTLDLGDNHKVSNQGIRYIAEPLKHNNSLKQLYLFGCGLTIQGVKSIAIALRSNSTLEELDISYNDLSTSDSESDNDLKQFAHALKDNHGLEVLHLSNCCMMDVEVGILANSLQHNKTLKILILFNYHYRDSIVCPNIISDGGADDLANFMCQNSTLLTLTLPVEIKSKVEKMQEKINDSRREKGPPFIKVNVESKFKFVTLNTHTPIEVTTVVGLCACMSITTLAAT